MVISIRDHIGIIPMYVGWGRDGALWFASELKALVEDCERFEEFPPGSFLVKIQITGLRTLLVK